MTTTRYWYQQGSFEKLPIELSIDILSFVHPVYVTIHHEMERLHRTMPNLDKYYLGGRLLPQDGEEDPYDPNTDYQVRLTLDAFVLLGQLVVLNRLLMDPIKRTSKLPGVDMELKHLQEGILHNTYPNCLRWSYVINSPIFIPEFYVYVSREMAVLSLYVCGWDYQVRGAAYTKESGEQPLVNSGYFKFYAREVALSKKRIAKHTDFVRVQC